MISETDVFDEVRHIVEKQNGGETVDFDSDLRTVEDMDSVRIVRAIAEVERKYHIRLDDDQVFSVKTVGDLSRIVHRQVSAQDVA